MRCSNKALTRATERALSNPPSLAPRLEAVRVAPAPSGLSHAHNSNPPQVVPEHPLSQPNAESREALAAHVHAEQADLSTVGLAVLWSVHLIEPKLFGHVTTYPPNPRRSPGPVWGLVRFWTFQ